MRCDVHPTLGRPGHWFQWDEARQLWICERCGESLSLMDTQDGREDGQRPEGIQQGTSETTAD